MPSGKAVGPFDHLVGSRKHVGGMSRPSATGRSASFASLNILAKQARDISPARHESTVCYTFSKSKERWQLLDNREIRDAALIVKGERVYACSR